MTTAENLINACNAKDRTTICTLIAAIPVNEWHVTEGHATSDQAHVTVQVVVGGGAGGRRLVAACGRRGGSSGGWLAT